MSPGRLAISILVTGPQHMYILLQKLFTITTNSAALSLYEHGER